MIIYREGIRAQGICQYELCIVRHTECFGGIPVPFHHGIMTLSHDASIIVRVRKFSTSPIELLIVGLRNGRGNDRAPW